MTPFASNSSDSKIVQKKLKSGLHNGIGLFFEYETSKVVQINSIKVGFMHRLIQLIIVSYIIGWVIIYKKGYQEFDNVVSSVTTKVKGVQFTNLSGTSIGARIWDVADYVIPPQENNAFFITTNAVVTNDQSQGRCPEDPDVALCSADSDCPPGKPQMLGNGVNTGRCVNSAQTPGMKSCEILAWCPVEIDRLPANSTIFPNAIDFTVLIKNSIEFPKFKTKRRNIVADVSQNNLTACHWEPNHPVLKYCPIFTVRDMLTNAGIPQMRIFSKGGIIAININWECNLDWPISHCRPEYKFSRLDEPDTRVAKGWNFRYANYYRSNNGTDYRVLVKAYGIRFVVYVTGQAGKFDIMPLTVNIGSGLALLGLATILCDIIVLYLLNKSSVYREAKFQTIQDDDAYKPMNEDDTTGDSHSSVGNKSTVQNEGTAQTGTYGATERR